VKKLESSISVDASRVASNYFLPSDRVLVLGATGWFGQTATAMTHLQEIPSLLIASNARDFKIGDRSFFANEWNETQIRDFNPTIIIDSAYITRDYVSKFDLNTYVAINRELTSRILSIKNIESIRKVITFSSGASVVHQATQFSNPLQEDPYGYLKFESEKRLQDELAQTDIDFAIVRAWSVSGALVTKVNGFAFSDLVNQARFGNLKVTASRKVFRRYCLVEEAIALSFFHNSRLDGILDTGGPLVEIRDLANIVRDVVSKKIVVEQSPVIQKDDDVYFSNGINWENACKDIGLTPSSISEQVNHVFNWLKD
jgi:nucleoside-diphosphate-sugar epimerase